MKVKVRWTETATYEAEVDVDGGMPESVTEEDVLLALEHGLLSDKIDRDRSCTAITERDIDGWDVKPSSVAVPEAPKHEMEW